MPELVDCDTIPATLVAATISDLNATLGAFEIGVMISIFLFGIVTVQTFTYYKNFPKDTWYLKVFVAFIWLLELTHTILVSHSIYYLSVIKYGQPSFIFEFPVSVIAAVGFQGIIGPAVQVYYAHRIRVVSGRWDIPCICWILSFLRCVSLLAITGESAGTRVVETFSNKYGWLMLSSLAISTAADVLIAASLCYFLWHQRPGMFKTTQWMIDQLISWTIQTGLLTSIGTVTMLIMLIVMKNFAWLAMLVVISRLFSNSLLATLNARTTFRGLGNQVNVVGDSNFQLQSTAPYIHVSMNRVGTSTGGWDVQQPLKAHHVAAADSKLVS